MGETRKKPFKMGPNKASGKTPISSDNAKFKSSNANNRCYKLNQRPDIWGEFGEYLTNCSSRRWRYERQRGEI